jgi:hypothetical protein
MEIFLSLDPDRWDQDLYSEAQPWMARDLLAHFVSAEYRLLELAKDVASGGPGAPPDFDIDEFNADEQERLRCAAAQDLLSELEHARQRTMDWVATLDEAQLDCIGRHPVLGNITVESMILAIYGHQLLHMRDLQRVFG